MKFNELYIFLKDFASSNEDNFEPEQIDALRQAAIMIITLQAEVDKMQEIVSLQGEVVQMAKRRHEERDEARRMYCLAVSENDKHLSAEDVADTWGWDCFKET